MSGNLDRLDRPAGDVAEAAIGAALAIAVDDRAGRLLERAGETGRRRMRQMMIVAAHERRLRRQVGPPLAETEPEVGRGDVDHRRGRTLAEAREGVLIDQQRRDLAGACLGDELPEVRLAVVAAHAVDHLAGPRLRQDEFGFRRGGALDDPIDLQILVGRVVDRPLGLQIAFRRLGEGHLSAGIDDSDRAVVKRVRDPDVIADHVTFHSIRSARRERTVRSCPAQPGAPTAAPCGWRSGPPGTGDCRHSGNSRRARP